MSLTNKKNHPFRIYLADLEYDTISILRTIPINIGYIASFLDEEYGEKIQIKLFEYPKKLDKAINDNPPDMLCLSYYTWNARLGELFIDKVKRLNPKAITIMGGPNIRRSAEGIYEFMKNHSLLDYYIMDYGRETEESISELVGEILKGNRKSHPICCATIINGKFYFKDKEWDSGYNTLNLPSPYLSGYLDEFLKDPTLIPMLETVRGCPFDCTYCTFGHSTLSRLRKRSLDDVFKDIDYIVEHCVGQKKWIISDANFGLFEEDLEIAKKIKKLKDQRGFPYESLIYDPKILQERTLKIYQVFGAENRPLIAIQTADNKVSRACMRGDLDFNAIKTRIKYYKEKGFETKTDIILGLPEESAKSHLETLKKCVDLGFDYIVPKEVRLIKGSVYEIQRKKYKIKTKFRPLFGAYGIYDNKIVFEWDEAVVSTKDMTEDELYTFKIHQFLLTYVYSTGMFKHILRFGQRYGIHPMDVLDELVHTKNPILRKAFDKIKKKTREDYFDTKEEMIKYYNNKKHYEFLVKDFFKIVYHYINVFYFDKKLYTELENEIYRLLIKELKAIDKFNKVIFDDMVDLTKKLICRDILRDDFSAIENHYGINIATILQDEKYAKTETILVEIYRPKTMVEYCRGELLPAGVAELTGHNLSRFLERKGLMTLSNKIRVIEEKNDIKNK